MNKRRPLIIAILLLITVGNFFRIHGNDNIRTIQFLYIFIIGALFALLLNSFIPLFRGRGNN